MFYTLPRFGLSFFVLLFFLWNNFCSKHSILLYSIAVLSTPSFYMVWCMQCHRKRHNTPSATVHSRLFKTSVTLQWGHNWRDGVSNHQPHRFFYSTVYSGIDQRQHQSSASPAFVRGIHRGPVNSPHKWPERGKFFHLTTSLWCSYAIDFVVIKGIRSGFLCIVKISGTQGCSLIGDQRTTS